MRTMSVFFTLLWFAAGTLVQAETPVAENVPTQAAAVVLRYDAFVGGAKVGEARVHVVIDDGRYQIQGSARTLGLLDTFSDWRNRFSARGEIKTRGEISARGETKSSGEGKVEGIQPLSFSYLEKDRDKRREVLVQEGALQVIKNGKVRPTLPAPAGLDVLTGLFVLPRCQGDQLLHTGRHHYRLTRLESQPGRCRYVVIDDDNDRYEVSVAFVSRGGIVVPHRVAVDGFLTGTVVLRDPEVALGETISRPGQDSMAVGVSGAFAGAFEGAGDARIP